MEERAGKLSLKKKKLPRSVGARFPDFGKRQSCEFAGARLPENVSKELEQGFQILEEQEKEKAN